MKTVEQITTAEIDYWTEIEQERAKEILPKLVCKLIYASCENIKNLHFPAGKSIQFCGVDGYLDVEDGNQFVPSGISVWEFSTSKNIKQKFNSNYEKRSTDFRGISLKDTTFCFVTTRIWIKYPGIGEFQSARKHEGKWKNVLIIDANVLENWLEHCPALGKD